MYSFHTNASGSPIIGFATPRGTCPSGTDCRRTDAFLSSTAAWSMATLASRRRENSTTSHPVGITPKAGTASARLYVGGATPACLDCHDYRSKYTFVVAR